MVSWRESCEYVDQARVHYLPILMRLIQSSIGLNLRKSPRLQWSSVGRPWWKAVVMTLSRCHVDMLSSTASNLSHSMLGDLSRISTDVNSVMSYSVIDEYRICYVPRITVFRVIVFRVIMCSEWCCVLYNKSEFDHRDYLYRGNSAHSECEITHD